MSAGVQNLLGALAIVVAVVTSYYVDTRYVYKKPSSFPAHFLRTGFFPKRALAYTMMITITLAVLASVRNGLPASHGAWVPLNNVVNVILYPLLFFLATVILSVVKIAIFPVSEDKG